MPPASDDAPRAVTELAPDGFEPVLAADGNVLYACSEWCGLMRSGFTADFAEAE